MAKLQSVILIMYGTISLLSFIQNYQETCTKAVVLEY